MKLSTEKNYNIIAQVMNDGAGDYAWISNLVVYLKKNDIPDKKINIYIINTYDFGKDLKPNLEKYIKHVNEFNEKNCKIITSENLISFGKSDIKDIITYTFERDNRVDFIDKLNNLNENIYKTEPISQLNSIKFKNVSELIGKIIKGFKTQLDKIKVGNYVCKIKRETIDNIYGKDYDSDIVSTISPGGVGYPITAISNNNPILRNIKIFYMSRSILDDPELLSAPSYIFEKPNTINIQFITGNILGIKSINIKEGGHTRNALACSTMYGYIQASPVCERHEDFEEFCKNNNLDAKKTCVAYISLGDDKHSLKLSKFIKVLCYSNDYEYSAKNVYTVYVTSGYDKIVKNNIVTGLNSDIKIVAVYQDNFRIKFNSKELIIMKGVNINVKANNFNFAYLLDNTNDYCLLSGDNSYMEGLTLNKKVVHVGMDNKYEMIQDLQDKINSQLDVKDLQPYEDIDKCMKSQIDYCNKSLQIYASYLSNSSYLNIQKKFIKKDFYNTLTTYIYKTYGGEDKAKYRKKYLKYKEKLSNLSYLDTATNIYKKDFLQYVNDKDTSKIPKIQKKYLNLKNYSQ